MKPLIFDGVSKRFGRREALVEVSFELPEGSLTVLLGENGAGKSTLMRLALGLLKADAGTVTVLGEDPVRRGAQVRQRTGYVPDTPDAPKWMKPRELFRFLAAQYDRWDTELVARLGERFRIPLETPLGRLSRGEAAKTMLAAALGPRPELLLFDEAFSGLDPVARTELLAGFIEEIRLERCACLLATHDLELAARVADRVIVLAQGQVEVEGLVDEVLGAPEQDELPMTRGLYELLQKARTREEVVAP